MVIVGDWWVTKGNIALETTMIRIIRLAEKIKGNPYIMFATHSTSAVKGINTGKEILGCAKKKNTVVVFLPYTTLVTSASKTHPC